MKISAKARLLLPLTVSIAAFLPSAFAGTIWDGGGLDDLWGSGANWDGDTSPVPGVATDLTFDGTTRLAPNNNFTAFDDFHSIFFAATAGAFTLSGSAIDLFGKIENYSTVAQTVGFDLAINAGQPGTGEFNPVNGDLLINGANVFTNGNTLRVYGVNNKTVTFGAGTVISQAGHFNVEQASNVVFLGANTYTGTTNVLAGTLTVGGGGTTGALGAGTVTVAAGATLTYNRSDAVTLGQTLNIGGALVNNGVGTLTISGAQAGITGTVAINAGRITMGANDSLGTAAGTLNGGTLERNAANVTVANNIAIGATGGTILGRQVVDNYTTFSGQLTGSGPLTIQGLVGLSNAANSYAGNITISNSSASFLRLIGSNRIGSTSNVTLGGGNASFRLEGTDATQTVAALNGTAGRIFSVGTGAITLTVGNTDASGTYAGTMDTGGGPLNLVKTGAGTQTLNRVGGNNAALTSVTVNAGTLALVHTTDNFDRGYFTGATPITVNAGGTVDATRLWTIKSTNVVNLNGGTLNFSSPFVVNVSDTNYVNNLTLQNGATISGPGGFRVGNVAGPTLTMNASGNATNTISTNLFFIKLAGITTYSMNVADGTAAVDLEVSGSIRENPSFTGMILNKAGAGRLRLSGTNLFGGATTISAGTLTLGAGGATGSLAGAITNDATLEIDRSGNVTIGNAISGTGVLNHIGTGTTTLTAANSYTGATNVSAGTLITSPAQTGATSVVVADGATFGVKLASAGTTFNATSLTTGVTTGATLLFDTGALGSPTAALINVTTFTPTAATVLRLTGSNLSAGPTFTLLDYTGSIGGTGYAGLSLQLPFRVGGSLVDNMGNTSVDVTISGAETAKWQGNVAGGDWDIDPDGGNTAGTINWKTSGLSTPTRYAQGAVNTDSVTFDDTATGTTNVNLTTTLTPVTVTVNNTAPKTYTFGGTGKISGATGLTKQGDGTLILANTTDNDYTGGTTISGGTLQLGDGVTAGGGAIGGAITNDATLAFNRPDDATVANVIGGSGSVLKAGAGRITLTAGNGYGGGTTIRSGTLEGVTNAAFGTGPITLGDAATGADNVALYLGNRADVLNAIIVSTDGTGTATLGGSNTGSGANAASFLGTVTLNRATIFDSQVVGDRLTFDGQITGNVGTLTVSGGSRTTLRSTTNNFTGDILVTGAGTILQPSVATASEVIPDGSSITVDAGAILQLASNIGTETIDALNGSGTVRTFITGTFGSGLAVGSAGGSGAFSGTIVNGTAGNPLSLTKLGAGTQALSGVNSYSGGTTISGGILNVNADAALGAATAGITIANNATLQASGAVSTSARTLTLGSGGGTIDTNGNDVTFDLGSSITGAETLTKIGAGKLTIIGSQSYDTLHTQAGRTDLASLLGNGTSTINADADINISVSQTLAALNIGGGAVVTLGTPLPPAPAFVASDGFAGGNVQAVPEPGSVALLFGGMLTLLGLRRRA